MVVVKRTPGLLSKPIHLNGFFSPETSKKWQKKTPGKSESRSHDRGIPQQVKNLICPETAQRVIT